MYDHRVVIYVRRRFFPRRGSTARSALGLILCVTAIAPSMARAESTYQLSVNARPTQFDLGTTLEFEGTTEPAPTLTVSESIGALTATATASPFNLSARTSTQDTGITITEASASFTRMRLDFEDNAALRGLIPPGVTALKLLVHFGLSVEFNIPNAPGIFNQANGIVSANLFASGLGFAEGIGGSMNVTNGPSDFSVSKFRLFDSDAFDDTGGSITAALPIFVSPNAPGGSGLRSFLTASVTASNLSLNAFVSTEILLSRAGVFVTLDDGVTDVRDLGVVYSLSPASVIPEPSSLALVALGLGVVPMSFRWRGRRKDVSAG
jgi:hypothetical protein